MIDPAWQQVYGTRTGNLHLPSGTSKRDELMIAYGRDGYHLLDQVYAPAAPDWLREIPAVDVLRRIWIQQFYRDADATTGRQEVRRRDSERDGGDGLPPGDLRIISPTTWTPGTASNATTAGAATKCTSARPAIPPAPAPTTPAPARTPAAAAALALPVSGPITTVSCRI